MTSMKNIIRFVVCFIGLVFYCQKGVAVEPKMPLYLGEFISKLGIKPAQLGEIKVINDSIARAVATVGYEIVEQKARQATDNLTGCPYFSFRDHGDMLVIEKDYTLIEDFRDLTLCIHRDKDGHFDFASFSEGTRY
jgi:hypothetical protein